MKKMPTLSAEDVARLKTSSAEAILHYLNLPPVGCVNDNNGTTMLDGDNAHELDAALRRKIRDRRDVVGAFQSPDELIGIEGFGWDALTAIDTRLKNLTRYGNRARAVWGGPESEAAFFALLESATRYIHISTYIVGGRAGMRLAELLVRKHREGVKVRIMFTATGFVISGSPSGTGFVSRFSELRSWAFNDMYVRKQIVRCLQEGGVPFLNTAPIGRHFRRRDFKKKGIRNRSAYEKWARSRGIPDAWIAEQAAIDVYCAVPFANVDHRKMVIVDGNRGFVGSQNLADSYFFSNELSMDPKVNWKKWQWLDNSTLLDGPVIAEVNQLFARRWALSGGDLFDPSDRFYTPPPERAGYATVNFEATKPGHVVLPFAKNLPRMLASFIGVNKPPISVGENPVRTILEKLPFLAESDLYVEHCYPSDAELLSSWARSAKRVEDFTMVVPFHYDTRILGFECDRMYPELKRSGIRLLGYDRAIIHSKIVVMDSFYTATGSFNLNLRSSRSDLELEFFIQCRDYGTEVKKRIIGDMAFSKPVEPGPMAKYRARHTLPVFDAVIRYLIL
jgi:phosphatidylserine/phosphatidylglycerophosphate/cardiolipin synthase-like enzyme